MKTKHHLQKLLDLSGRSNCKDKDDDDQNTEGGGDGRDPPVDPD